MATALGVPQHTQLAERSDIHKSCKALETIINVFNEYCQAAEALAVVQKRLAKALKEAAGLKATNDIAGESKTSFITSHTLMNGNRSSECFEPRRDPAGEPI